MYKKSEVSNKLVSKVETFYNDNLKYDMDVSAETRKMLAEQRQQWGGKEAALEAALSQEAQIGHQGRWYRRGSSGVASWLAAHGTHRRVPPLQLHLPLLSTVPRVTVHSD